MKILGLSSNYHDASAALVINGAVVAAAAEERFTLQKHDPTFPHLAAKFCLAEAGISADSLDYIAYHEDPTSKFSRTLASSTSKFPFSLSTFIKSMREAVTGGFWIKDVISRSLEIDPRKIVYVPHHCGHAAHGFLTSPFQEAAILTLDAAGEWMCSGFFQGNRSLNEITPLEVIPFPHSLGLVYSAFTGYLGFKVNDGECSTMALASFGEPRFADKIRKIIRLENHGTYSIDISYFDFSRDDSLPLTKKFYSEFGAGRPYKSTIPFDCLEDGEKTVDPDNQRFADIASSLQLVLEESVIHMAKAIKAQTGSNNICLSGGVALNCVAVGKLIQSKIFENVFVPPDPGDGGGALGAALFLAHSKSQMPAPSQYHPYQGKSYDEQEVLSILPFLENGKDICVRSKGNFEKVVSLTSKAIKEGKIVGWIQGRFEVGPRALGNRSILCDPSRIDTARHLSRSVKKRAAFRPYACSIAEEEVNNVFASDTLALPSLWMQTALPIKENFRAALRAASHRDGTTRPHVCTPSQNPRLHQLLQAVKKETGMGAVLNTSFNERGMPMVASPMEALLMFIRTDMDILVINDTLLEKERSQ